MYMVVGVNSKREMVLSPNDEEVANSSKKHTQFKTRVPNHTLFQTKMVKLIPYFGPKQLKKHTLWRGTYRYSLYKGLPPWGKKRVAGYESRCFCKRD